MYVLGMLIALLFVQYLILVGEMLRSDPYITTKKQLMLYSIPLYPYLYICIRVIKYIRLTAITNLKSLK